MIQTRDMMKMWQRIAQSCLEFDVTELCIAHKNYANLQAVVKTFQLFISNLSTINNSTNQILIPGAGITEWRINGMSTGSPAHSLITRILPARPTHPRLDYT